MVYYGILGLTCADGPNPKNPPKTKKIAQARGPGGLFD
jgi:hypothetical protein